MFHLTKNDIEKIACLILENWGHYNGFLTCDPINRFVETEWGEDPNIIKNNIGFPDWDRTDDYWENEPAKKTIRSIYWGFKDDLEKMMNGEEED